MKERRRPQRPHSHRPTVSDLWFLEKMCIPQYTSWQRECCAKTLLATALATSKL